VGLFFLTVIECGNRDAPRSAAHKRNLQSNMRLARCGKNDAPVRHFIRGENCRKSGGEPQAKRGMAAKGAKKERIISRKARKGAKVTG